MLLAVALLVTAFALVVSGVALLTVPGAFIVAGILVGLAALYVDFDRKGGRK